MGEITRHLTPIVESILRKNGVGLDKAKEKNPLTAKSGRASYIVEERYEIANTTSVNRVYSTEDPSVWVDVTEKTLVDMESSKGGVSRDHYLEVNG
jgi:hypothetical protein